MTGNIFAGTSLNYMDDTLTYRGVTAADKEQVKELGWLAYSQYAPLLTPEHLETLRTNMYNDASWTSLLAIAGGYVCTHNEAIIGMAFLVPHDNPNDLFKAEWAYIRMVGVHPAYQGQGIARQLTTMCIDYARSLDEQTIALHTSEAMPIAMHIYESMGFVRQYEVPRRLGLRYWIYTMEL